MVARFVVFGVLLVGFDDHLDELVADDVFFVEIDKLDAFEIGKDVLGLFDAAFLPAGQVDLGLVAGDDGLGAEPDTREEHFHLLARGVLRLVEDDECVRERAAAHKRERSDLDDAFLEHFCDFLAIDEVEQSVVKRAEIRIDLVLKIAGKETEAFAGLDRRTREDDAADLFFHQSIDRHRYREKALARTGNADPEHEIVSCDRVEIFALVGGFGGDRFFAGRVETRF